VFSRIKVLDDSFLAWINIARVVKKDPVVLVTMAPAPKVGHASGCCMMGESLNFGDCKNLYHNN
jgi:hypothetical protein